MDNFGRHLIDSIGSSFFTTSHFTVKGLAQVHTAGQISTILKRKTFVTGKPSNRSENNEQWTWGGKKVIIPDWVTDR